MPTLTIHTPANVIDAGELEARPRPPASPARSSATAYRANAFTASEHDALVLALAELEMNAQEGLRDLAMSIRENNRRKDVVRHLQNLVRQIDAARIEGPNDGSEGKRSMLRHPGSEAMFQELERVLAENPWLAGTDIEKDYHGLNGGGDAEKRMSALAEAIKGFGDTLSDLTQTQTIDLQIAQNQAQKAGDARSNWLKAKHGMAMTAINNMRG